MSHPFTNELIHETSPYLLQHAHNPVEWHSWSENVLAKARESDRPILVSIGYSACHWCHVMERESFEDEATARYMNEYFVNIKIDREERPDLDHIYMDAVQVLTGSGGWPLNVFLTPDGKPFYGGTYFPPEKAFNRASWKDILFFISDAWQNRRAEIEKQAETLLEHITTSTQFKGAGNYPDVAPSETFFTEEKARAINEALMKSADLEHGGFGRAPKFPQTFSIQYLLTYGHYFNDEKSMQHALYSLKQLIEAGIYDQLAGGMARYSTDAQWHVPHFEKMLYDNALLVSVLCDAYQLTSELFYKNAIEKTLNFFIQNMKHSEGGFYAALDADSEGVEGKFYVWRKAEIETVLGSASTLFCEFYGVTEAGNWEAANILHISESRQNFALRNNIDSQSLDFLLSDAENKLLTERNKRVKPQTDDKILLGWNSLLLTSFCKASASLDEITYKTEAISLYNFINERFTTDGAFYHHTYKNNSARQYAYLDDYAYFIQACIWLQQITGETDYLEKAKNLTSYVFDSFFDEKDGFFYYTNQQQTDIIVRKKEFNDNAIPSGNSIMSENLFYLSVVFDQRGWWQAAMKMLIALSDIVVKHPGSFGIWANIIVKHAAGIDEIVITGQHGERSLKEILKLYLPGKILQFSKNEKDYPLLKNKVFTEKTNIYRCRNYACSSPIASVSALKEQLKIKIN